MSFFICCQHKQVFCPWRIVIRELAARKLSGFAILYAISSGLVFYLRIFGNSSSGQII